MLRVVHFFTVTIYSRGWRVISGSLIWSKPCQIHSPLLHAGAPGIFWELLRYVQMLKRDSEVRNAMRSYPHLFIPNKTETLIPEYMVKTCLWAEHSMMMMILITSQSSRCGFQCSKALSSTFSSVFLIEFLYFSYRVGLPTQLSSRGWMDPV